MDFPPEGLILKVAVPGGVPGGVPILKILLDGIQTVLDSQRNSSFRMLVWKRAVVKYILDIKLFYNVWYGIKNIIGILPIIVEFIPCIIFFQLVYLKCLHVWCVSASGTMVNSQQYDYLKRIYLGSIKKEI